MLAGVIWAKSRFFDINPIGRIINRFSKDLSSLDELMPNTLYDFLQVSTWYNSTFLLLYPTLKIFLDLFDFFLKCSIVILGTLTMAIVINYFILIPLVPLVIIFVYVRMYYVSTCREVKRIESISECLWWNIINVLRYFDICLWKGRSPIFVHATNTFYGLTTIRACKNESIFQDEFFVHYDHHTKSYFTLISTNR